MQPFNHKGFPSQIRPKPLWLSCFEFRPSSSYQIISEPHKVRHLTMRNRDCRRLVFLMFPLWVNDSVKSCHEKLCAYIASWKLSESIILVKQQ